MQGEQRPSFKLKHFTRAVVTASRAVHDAAPKAPPSPRRSSIGLEQRLRLAERRASGGNARDRGDATEDPEDHPEEETEAEASPSAGTTMQRARRNSAETWLGRSLLWMHIEATDPLAEKVAKTVAMHVLSPFRHVLASGFDISRYLLLPSSSKSRLGRDVPANSRPGSPAHGPDRSAQAERGALEYLVERCEDLGLTAYMNDSLAFRRRDAVVHVVAVDREGLLSVLDEVLKDFNERRKKPPDDRSGGIRRRDLVMAKRLCRLQFVLRHMRDVEADHVNIYQAAYLDPTLYGLRAFVTAVAQVASVWALFLSAEYPWTASTRDAQGPLIGALVFVYISWMCVCLPSNLIPATWAHSALMAYLLVMQNRLYNAVYAVLDMCVNQLLVMIMPVITGYVLMGAETIPEVVLNSMSVLFVIGLDDSSLTTGEQLYLDPAIQDVVTRVIEGLDAVQEPDWLVCVGLVPVVEMLLCCALFAWSFVIVG